jgi:hypothetical protein
VYKQQQGKLIDADWTFAESVSDMAYQQSYRPLVVVDRSNVLLTMF